MTNNQIFCMNLWPGWPSSVFIVTNSSDAMWLSGGFLFFSDAGKLSSVFLHKLHILEWQVTLLKVTSPLIIKNYTAGLHVSGKLSESATDTLRGCCQTTEEGFMWWITTYATQNTWMLQSYENIRDRIWDGVIVMVLIHLGNNIVFVF